MVKDEKSALQKETDVEKQVEALLSPEPLKKDVDFLQSLVSLGTITEAKRTPVISGVVILIYLIFCTKLVIGMITLKVCTVNAFISIYLIVAGVTGIGIKILFGTRNKCLFSSLLVLALFYLIWHVICSYFVFKEYHPHFDPRQEPYCSRVAFLVAFWSIVVQYMVFVIFLMLFICTFLMKRDACKT